MTSPIVLDFETYFAPKDRYSLRVMSIEQYVLDARFQVHGCTVLDADVGIHKFMGLPEFKLYLGTKDWSKQAVLSHNARFDMAILAWRFGLIPGAYIDTLSIANVHIMPHTGSVSLQKCCEHMGIAGKDPNVLGQCAGLRTEEIKRVPGLWRALVQYAVGDGEKALAIYREHWWKFEPRERLIMDWSIRNYVRSRLNLDTGLLYDNLAVEEGERAGLLKALGLESPSVLRSTKSFADHLLKLGVDVRYKPGKNGDIPAFAKDDDFMRAMANHSDQLVRVAIKGRLAFQSNLEITRTKRLLDMALITGSRMLIPLNYCAAHTGRFGGAESINVQNLRRGSLLRRAIKAPAGHKLVCVDAAQIECRLLGWLAGCKRIVDAFAAGRDLYAEFASSVFSTFVTKETHPVERQVGKVSILQLGYQSGSSKLQRKLEASGIVVTAEQAVKYVIAYRTVYAEIPRLWHKAETTLREAVRTKLAYEFVVPGMLVTHEGIKLPSGRWLFYPKLREVSADEVGVDERVFPGQLVYWSPRYKSWKQLYGGSITENIIQAMARDVVIESQVKFLADVVLQVHDDLVQCVREQYAGRRLQDTIKSMSTAPKWCVHPTLKYPPLSAEGYISDCYADTAKDEKHV